MCKSALFGFQMCHCIATGIISAVRAIDSHDTDYLWGQRCDSPYKRQLSEKVNFHSVLQHIK